MKKVASYCLWPRDTNGSTYEIAYQRGANEEYWKALHSKSDLKSHSELAEDILESFEDTCRQVNTWKDSAAALLSLQGSFRGILTRAIRNLKEAERER